MRDSTINPQIPLQWILSFWSKLKKKKFENINKCVMCLVLFTMHILFLSLSFCNLQRTCKICLRLMKLSYILLNFVHKKCKTSSQFKERKISNFDVCNLWRFSYHFFGPLVGRKGPTDQAEGYTAFSRNKKGPRRGLLFQLYIYQRYNIYQQFFL